MRETRKVLHLIETTGPGGAETVFLQLASHLNSARWRSVTSIPGKGWVYESLRARGIEPIVIPTSRSCDIPYLAALRRLIRTERVDLLQAHLLGSSLYGGFAGLLSRVPVIATLHGEWDLPPRGRAGSLKIKLIERASVRIVVVSEALQQTLLARFAVNAARTAVIHNGIDLLEFRPERNYEMRRELGLEPHHVLVGAVGNVRPSKDYATFLQAARILTSRCPHYRFVIAGEAQGPLFENLSQLRDGLGLREKVLFLGFRDDIRRVLGTVDIFVCSSTREGFSLATVQALACGVPVVATRSGGPEVILRDGSDGLLVEPRSPSAIADAVERLRCQPYLRKRLIHQGLLTVRSRFSLNHMVEKYEQLYEEALVARE